MIDKILLPYSDLKSVDSMFEYYIRRGLIGDESHHYVYYSLYSDEYWRISVLHDGNYRDFKTKEDAAYELDQILIRKGYILLNSWDQANKYRVLI